MINDLFHKAVEFALVDRMAEQGMFRQAMRSWVSAQFAADPLCRKILGTYIPLFVRIGLRRRVNGIYEFICEETV